MRTKWMVLWTFVVCAAGFAAAQSVTSHPGYFPIEEMGILAKGDLEVDVDLQGAMLEVAAGAMEGDDVGDDSDFAELVSNLERVRVLVGSPSGADKSTIAHSIDQATARLESSNWDRILSVEEAEEQVYVYATESGGRILGVTVLVNDGAEEIVVVNIVGDIDPRVLGRVIAGMDEMPDLEGFMSSVE
jgi:hypothetical protein